MTGSLRALIGIISAGISSKVDSGAPEVEAVAHTDVVGECLVPS